ncbi:MAG: ABC transporter permease [Saprospiraceae bacterium]|nr:ABC transporter permease [Saprospiraceae bacterium]
MWNRIFGKIVFVILLFFTSVWLIHYFIDFIPGTYADFKDPLESNEEIIQQKERFPIFYFSLIPNKEEQITFDQKNFFNPKWNGSQNAFHQTISSLVQGNFGKSLVDDAPVLQKIKSAIVWTLSIQIPHYLLLFFIAIYFGKYSTLYNHGVIKLTKEVLLALHSIPLFWLASILLLLFSTQLFNLPNSFMNIADQNPFLAWIQYPQYFILPLLSMILPSISYVSRLYGEGLTKAMQSSFWIRAMSTGNSNNYLLETEAKPHAMIAIYAWLIGTIPSLIVGSLIIENLFAIPGMGRLLFHSIAIRDWPVVKVMLMLISFVSLIGYLISDFAIKKLDPRLNHKNEGI